MFVTLLKWPITNYYAIFSRHLPFYTHWNEHGKLSCCENCKTTIKKELLLSPREEECWPVKKKPLLFN